jgi:hypothetical protein
MRAPQLAAPLRHGTGLCARPRQTRGLVPAAWFTLRESFAARWPASGGLALLAGGSISRQDRETRHCLGATQAHSWQHGFRAATKSRLRCHLCV